MFRSDNLSTISVLREVLSKEATQRKTSIKITHGQPQWGHTLVCQFCVEVYYPGVKDFTVCTTLVVSPCGEWGPGCTSGMIRLVVLLSYDTTSFPNYTDTIIDGH